MKILVIIICINLGILENVASQNLLLNYNIGITNGEMYNLKKNMFCMNTQIGYEIKIHRFALINASIGFEKIKFAYSENINDQIFNTKTNILITTKINKPFYFLKNGNHFFFALGISGNIAVADKKEIFKTGAKTIVNKKLKGHNIASLLDIGYKFILSENSAFSISLLSQYDFYKNYTEKFDEIKYERTLFSVGYYHNLKKQ